MRFILMLLFAPIRFIPRRLEMFLGYILGLFMYNILRFRRNIVRKNLLTAFKKEISKGEISTTEINKIEVDNYIHYGRLFFELLHLPFDAKRFATKNVNVYGLGNLEKASKKGKGVFFLTAHVGYWEIMSVVGTIFDIKLNVLTKYLRVKLLDKIWVKSRESYGIKLIGEVFTAKDIIKAIRANEAVGYVLDQFTGPPIGVKVNFFNKLAWTAESLAWFVRHTGASVIPVYNVRNSDGSFDLHIYPEVDFEANKDKKESIKINTQNYSNIVENFIRHEPSQWLWLHKRWKTVKEDGKNAKNIY